MKKKANPIDVKGHGSGGHHTQNPGESGYRGVTFIKERKKGTHSSIIRLDKNNIGKYRSALNPFETSGKTIVIGFYPTAREAAVARDKKILELGFDIPLQVLKPKTLANHKT